MMNNINYRFESDFFCQIRKMVKWLRQCYDVS